MRAGPRPWKKPAGPSFLRIWRIVWITLSFLTMASLEELGSPVATVVRTVWRVCEGGESVALKNRRNERTFTTQIGFDRIDVAAPVVGER